MLTPERIARLRLAPLRSMRALAEPQHAMRRAARFVGLLCDGAAVRATAPSLGCAVERPASRDPHDARDHTVERGDDGLALVRIDVRCAPQRWEAVGVCVERLAESLALVLALHARPARALRGVWLGAQCWHDINNTVNALTLQASVVQSLLERGRTDEAAAFAERCAHAGDRLVAQLMALHAR